MRVELEEINKWARLSADVGAGLRRLLYLLGMGELTPQKAHEALCKASEAQTVNNRLLQSILRAGADDPRYSPEERRAREENGPTLANMQSDANKRLAALLREAAGVAAIVERERGEDSWLSEILADYAEARELEVNGPTGLDGTH